LTKIGLLGGTFNPVHNGHLSIAKSFLNSGKIDQLWILLTPFPPHKIEEKHVSYLNRLKMLRSAFTNMHVRILTIENKLPIPSYTYRTIQYLKKESTPDARFFFCMGEDSLEKFSTWKHYDLILNEADLLVAKRPDTSHEEVSKEILDKTVFVDHHPIDISSTEIRERIKEKDFIEKVLPDDVISLISKENLYQ